MRTTLEIDDPTMQEVRDVARRSGLTLGETVTSLLRTGLEQRRGLRIKHRGKVPVIQTPPGATPPDIVKLVREWKEKG